MGRGWGRARYAPPPPARAAAPAPPPPRLPPPSRRVCHSAHSPPAAPVGVFFPPQPPRRGASGPLRRRPAPPGLGISFLREFNSRAVTVAEIVSTCAFAWNLAVARPDFSPHPPQQASLSLSYPQSLCWHQATRIMETHFSREIIPHQREIESEILYLNSSLRVSTARLFLSGAMVCCVIFWMMWRIDFLNEVFFC
ncbi:unnamed protein product [Nyctereutes procyonoides]|uniref:(raccoon dog) hypothetical protein n=1 Tax=Nyctereutes procyonoides TaxID=34880 RepID=A0A811YZZ4_NYCPR|nr:unnamed protein product [Nyctereutes procyonoides]CAD7682111.1 unnamed protein product [Nyctereutes procyonoides]